MTGKKSPAARASIGLALGLNTGVAIELSGSQTLKSAAGTLEPIGTLWVNAIRMTVIPLVVSLLIATIAQEKNLGAVGRLGGRAVAIFAVLLTGCAVIGFVAGPPIFTLLHIDPAAAAALRATVPASASKVELPTFASWLVSLIPANPIKAAADGAMLPLIIFAVAFAAALARTPSELRIAGGNFFRAIADAMRARRLGAVSTRSSVAALPAMIDGAERVLELPTRVTSFALPFGVSIFRLNQGISWVVAALFIGALYDIQLTIGQLAVLAAASVPMSFSVPGIPSGGLFVITPFFMTVGLPVEGIGILIALDVIPDLFKTLINVTGHMTSTVLLSRNQPRLESA